MAAIYSSHKIPLRAAPDYYHRRSLRMDLLYGRNSVFEALRAGRRRIRRVLVASGAHGLEALRAEAQRKRVGVEAVDRHRLDQLCGGNHQGVVAEAGPFADVHLDELSDPPERPTFRI